MSIFFYSECSPHSRPFGLDYELVRVKHVANPLGSDSTAMAMANRQARRYEMCSRVLSGLLLGILLIGVIGIEHQEPFVN